MQADDVRALRQSAVPTAAVGVLCAIVGSLVGGEKGALGAVLALAMVTVFFAISSYVVGRAARVSPQSMMIVALSTYMVKILALAVITAQFRDTTLFNGRVFGFTAIVCVLTWCGTQVRALVNSKILYVEPAQSTPAAKQPTGGV
jgi:ATP synthase protein I